MTMLSVYTVASEISTSAAVQSTFLIRGLHRYFHAERGRWGEYDNYLMRNRSWFSDSLRAYLVPVQGKSKAGLRYDMFCGVKASEAKLSPLYKYVRQRGGGGPYVTLSYKTVSETAISPG